MSKTSSSLISRLHGIFSSSRITAVKPALGRSPRKPKKFVNKSKKPSTSVISAAATAEDGGKSAIVDREDNLRKKIERFKRSCESDNFRQSHGPYSAFVRRLIIQKKFTMIDEIIQYQKKFEDIKSEEFVIRMMLLYGYSGMAEHAHKLFDEMPKLNCDRTIKSFNALLSSYVNSKKLDEAVKLLKEFPEKLGITPDLVTYNTMIKGYSKEGSLNDLLLVLGEMEKNGLEPDLITFNTLFEAFYGRGWSSEGDKIWEMMGSKNLVPNIRSYNSRIRGLAKHKKFSEAINLIDEMKAKGISPDTLTYNALILAYRDSDNLEETMKWYDALKENDQHPDRVTYCIIVPFLCGKGKLETAVELCKESIERKLVCHPSLFKPVIEFLVGKGKIDEAMEIVKTGKLKSYFKYHSDLPIPK